MHTICHNAVDITADVHFVKAVLSVIHGLIIRYMYELKTRQKSWINCTGMHMYQSTYSQLVSPRHVVSKKVPGTAMTIVSSKSHVKM